MSLASGSISDDATSTDGSTPLHSPTRPLGTNSPATASTQLSLPRGIRRKASSTASGSSSPLSSPPSSPVTNFTLPAPTITVNDSTSTFVPDTHSSPSGPSVKTDLAIHPTQIACSAPRPTCSNLQSSPQDTHSSHARKVFNLTDMEINAIIDLELLDVYMYKIISRLHNEEGKKEHVRAMSGKEMAIF